MNKTYLSLRSDWMKWSEYKKKITVLTKDELEQIEKLSDEELLGFFDTEEDNGDFVLDLNQAREDRAEEILKRNK